MKKNLNYILYGIALIAILLPIFMQEAMGQSLPQLTEWIFLSIGVLFLIAGKILVIQKKRRETGEPIYMDLIIILGLIVMIAWMFINEA